MSNIIRQVLAVLAGIAVGSAVNMALVGVGPRLIPPPPGVNMNDLASLRQALGTMGPEQFVMPFLAHALGTLSGALVALLLGGRSRQRLAWIVGAFFLCGGVAAGWMLGGPAWFVALDLVAAYLPMAWVAGRLLGRGAV